jgi:hypothetical protein
LCILSPSLTCGEEANMLMDERFLSKRINAPFVVVNVKFQSFCDCEEHNFSLSGKFHDMSLSSHSCLEFLFSHFYSISASSFEASIKYWDLFQPQH